MFKYLFILSLLFLNSTFGAAIETIVVPGGTMSPVWLVPTSTKQKVTEEKKIELIVTESFQAMKYPVTIEQFHQFLNKNKKWQKKNISPLFADKSYLKSFSTHKKNSKTPVTEVSWFAARAFCESEGMRLPTLNEWEYMAAASEKIADANRDEKFLQRILNWYGEPYGGKIKPVGSIYKNMYGLWDLHGLIWEWVEDFNSVFVTGESREDSSFNKDMFCGAGGLSGANKENYAAFMRFAFRSGLKGNSAVWNLGFRCVRSI